MVAFSKGRIGMLVLPNFNGMACHAFIDPFRAANYLGGRAIYEWSLLSPGDGPVTASNGFTLGGTLPFGAAEATSFDLLVVNSSWTPEAFATADLLSWLRRSAAAGVTLCAIDTGAFILAEAGLLDGYKATVHYEHMASFRELYPRVELAEQIFVGDSERMSCAGGVAAADMALEIIRLRQGIDLANAAARYIFHERLRSGSEGQFSAAHEPVGYTVPERVRDAILLMERNCELPLRQDRIAARLGVSQRQLERLFRKFTGMTPAHYYLNVRLDNARGLVTQTQMPLAEIAIACGFGGGGQLGRAYRHRFGLPPGRDRIEGRIPFQFRSFPLHASQ